jgi:hypothetical protein
MDQIAYQKKYPNYCKECNGRGRWTNAEGQVGDCDECLKQGLCPQCGEQALSEMEECTKCRWSSHDRDRGLPGGISNGLGVSYPNN